MLQVIDGPTEPVTEEVEDLPEQVPASSGAPPATMGPGAATTAAGAGASAPLPALGAHGAEADHTSGFASSRQAHADMLAHSPAPGVRAHATHSPVTPVVIPPRVAGSFPTNAALSPDTPMAIDDSPAAAAGVQRPGVPGAPLAARAGAEAGAATVESGVSAGVAVVAPYHAHHRATVTHYPPIPSAPDPEAAASPALDASTDTSGVLTEATPMCLGQASPAGTQAEAGAGAGVAPPAPTPVGFALTFKVMGSGATKGAVTLTVTKQETVGSLKARLACELDVPDVQLVKGGDFLAAETTVAEAGLAGGSVIHCVAKVRCCGGLSGKRVDARVIVFSDNGAVMSAGWSLCSCSVAGRWDCTCTHGGRTCCCNRRGLACAWH
jgi:hypothetical protein